MSKFAVGIDLGTTYSAVAVYRKGKVEVIQNSQGERNIPSYVAFTQNEHLIGQAAYYQASTNPENTIYAVKRLIGREFDDASVKEDIKTFPFKVITKDSKIFIQVRCNGKTQHFYPEEISALILEDLKKTAECYLDRKVTDVVITVPSYFNDGQRSATKAAAEIAGLNVLRIINEPTAAALAYGIRGVVPQKSLIFDFGGGTFDITIMDISGKNYTVICTKGDSHLGGEDIDQRLVEYFVEELKDEIQFNKEMLFQLKKECENVKRRLTSSIETTLVFANITKRISKACFEEICYDIFDKAMNLVKEAIEDANLVKSQINTILLVGGTARIPKMREMLSDYFDNKSLNQTVNADEVVAMGAAYQAALLTDKQLPQSLKGIKLVDVCRFSLGIELIDGGVDKVITRNTPIPVTKTEQYTTVFRNQSSIKLAVYEGEGSTSRNNHYLGEFILDGIPPAPTGEGGVDCTFQVDINGILTVCAVELTTGNQNHIVIANESRLNYEEIKSIANRRQLLRQETQDYQDHKKAVNEFEELLYGVKRTTNDYPEAIRQKLEVEVKRFDEWFNNNNKLATKFEFVQKMDELRKVIDTFLRETKGVMKKQTN